MSEGERKAFALLLQSDPLILATVYSARWDQFRRDVVTAIVERIAVGVRQRRPKVRVSAAVFADDQDAYLRRFQDWKLWTERGLLDIVCPMAYTPDTETFKRQIAIARGFSFGRQVWAGIGAYRQPVQGTLEKIEVARRIGADGIQLFSYDSLVRPSATNPLGDYLKVVGERAFGVEAAGSRATGARRPRIPGPYTK
ncbi:MAG: family 10 glycosylhydrolase [Vicinamibacterales bacterium]